MRPVTTALGEGPEQAESWRQAMDSGELLLVAAAGMLVVAAVAQTAAVGLVQPRIALAFGALICFGEVLRLSLEGGRESAPIGSAGAFAYAVVLIVGGYPATQAALQVIAVVAAGMVLGALPHLAAGRPAGLAGLASRLIAVAVVAVLFRPLSTIVTITRPRDWGLALGAMAAVLVAGWLADCLIRALISADALRARFRVALWDEMRVQLPLGFAVAATAILIAFAADMMGLVALGVFIAPLLVTQMAFRRYAGIRATYLETVRALARVTEVGGYVAGNRALIDFLHHRDCSNWSTPRSCTTSGSFRCATRSPVVRPCWPPPSSNGASPSWGPASSTRPGCWTAWRRSCGTRAGPGAARTVSRRSAAGSSAPPTPSTTWSAPRPRPAGRWRRSNGCAWTPRPSMTPGWSRHWPRLPGGGTGAARSSLPGC